MTVDVGKINQILPIIATLNQNFPRQIDINHFAIIVMQSTMRLKMSAREASLLEYKRSIAKTCASKLGIEPPLPELKPLVLHQNDSVEIREQKMANYKEERAKIESLKREREPDILRELDILVLRVKETIGEEGFKNQYAIDSFKQETFYCPNCKNRVTFQIFCIF